MTAMQESWYSLPCDGRANDIQVVPDNLPGYVVVTPPINNAGAERFRACCWGEVYNVTGPTDPSHPAYPVSCGLVCQVHPDWKFGGANFDNPDGMSDLMLCWSDGGRIEESSDEIPRDCYGWMNTLVDEPAPSSYPSTPVFDDWTSYWTFQVDSTALGPHWESDHPFRTTWYRIAEQPSAVEQETLATAGGDGRTSTALIATTATETGFESPSAVIGASESPSTTGAPTSSPVEEDKVLTSRATRIGLNRILITLLALYFVY
ncbi:hypothetical protein BJX68DRAFT_271927 [Aspergillus pseudodeflectus]|uniref:Uncharacterized protein n=1 Tax=Aspergillus pseudodeflectus TaxID=176178 RepID=A0ABR4JLB1_9EURO